MARPHPPLPRGDSACLTSAECPSNLSFLPARDGRDEVPVRHRGDEARGNAGLGQAEGVGGQGKGGGIPQGRLRSQRLWATGTLGRSCQMPSACPSFNETLKTAELETESAAGICFDVWKEKSSMGHLLSPGTQFPMLKYKTWKVSRGMAQLDSHTKLGDPG